MLGFKRYFILGLFAATFALTSCSKAPPVAQAYKQDENNSLGASPGEEGGGDEGGGGTTFAAEAYYTDNNCSTCHPALFDFAGSGQTDQTVELAADIAEHASYSDTWPSGADAQALADYINAEYP